MKNAFWLQILNNMTEDQEFNFVDGRKICIDREITTGNFVVSIFEVRSTYWDNDYQTAVPVRDLTEQRTFATVQETADYIASKI